MLHRLSNFLLLPIIFTCFVNEVTAQYPDEFVVCTFNIKYDNPNDLLVWEDRKQEVARSMAFFDIVGLQEVLPHQLADILSELPWMDSYSRGREADGSGESCAILWPSDKFDLLHSETRWLSELWTEEGSVGWDADLPRIASLVLLHHKATGKVVRVVNSHWSHVGEEARMASASLIRSWSIKSDADAVIVMGDYNAEPSTPEIQFLLEGTLDDTYDTAETRCRKQFGTYTTFDPAGVGGPRIDYILTRGVDVLWTCADEYIVKVFYISDHLPVHAVLKW
jgi:endonuclease/exonuclease/phosphatase family metal-dependent hydrolase